MFIQISIIILPSYEIRIPAKQKVINQIYLQSACTTSSYSAVASTPAALTFVHLLSLVFSLDNDGSASFELRFVTLR